MKKDYPEGFKTLTEQDFNDAQEWFDVNPETVKYERKSPDRDPARNYFFLKASDGVIYALQDTHTDKDLLPHTRGVYAGMPGYHVGGAAVVKKVVNREGIKYAIRILNVRGAERGKRAHEILKKLKILKASIEKKVNHLNQF